MNKHDIGGPLFVGLLCLAVFFVLLQFVAWGSMHLVKARSKGQETGFVRALQRITIVSTIAAPACFLLAGAVFVWLSQ